MSYYNIQVGDRTFAVEHGTENIPKNEDVMIKSIFSILIKNELTVQQARILLQNCIKTLDTTPLGNTVSGFSNQSSIETDNDSLQSIADSLSKIANKGVDTFSRCITTNN